jgi:hypothetical protein
MKRRFRSTVETIDLSRVSDRLIKWSRLAHRAVWWAQRLPRRLRSSRNAKAIYYDIGRYVVIFQALEGELLQICWLLAEPAYNPSAQAALAQMPFKRLLRETDERIGVFREERGLDDTEFRRSFWSRFHDVLAHCREIADQRNIIVHSAYVHLEAGGELHGILRSDMKAKPGAIEAEFDHEFLAARSFDQALRDLSLTTWHLGRCRMQLIHWRDRPRRGPDTSST